MKKIIIVGLCAMWCYFSAVAQQVYSLAQLKDSALVHNAAIRKATFGIEQAEEQRKEAFTNFFPQVAAVGAWFNANRGMARMEVKPTEFLPECMQSALGQLQPALEEILPTEAIAALGRPIGMSMMKNGAIASVTAVQPIFVGGQIVNGNRLARLGEDVSRLQLRLSEREVEQQVEHYYWQMVTLQEKQKTLAAARQMLDTIHRDVSLAVQAGLILRNDLLQVELRQNELESQRLKLDNGLGLLEMLIAQYCGIATDMSADSSGHKQGFVLEAPDFLTVPAVLPHAPQAYDEALSALPEYQLLQRQVDAAVLQRKMEQGKNLPCVAIGAGYNYHNLMDNNRTFGMVFATVSVPLSGWWGGAHAVKRRTLAVRRAREELENKAELLAIGRKKAWNDVQEAFSQCTIARRSICQAEENLRVQRDGYNAGTITIGDLLQAQLLAQQAQDGLTEARANYELCKLAYRQASGE